MINTLTLNPAIDKILYVDRFVKNVTTRIIEQKETLGGKGTHVSLNLSFMGKGSRAFGICFGGTGDKIIGMMKKNNIDVCFIKKDRDGADSRTNYLINERSGDSTLITERGEMLLEEDLSELKNLMSRKIAKNDFLVFSGDASNYKNSFVYNDIMDALAHLELKVFIDTSGQALKNCLKAKPFLIKPNLDELEVLCERKISCEISDIVCAIDSLNQYEIPCVAVSLGEEGSIVRHYDEYYRVIAPKVRAVNTVGCGDCYLSGLLYGFESEMDIRSTLAHATAYSAACALVEDSVGFDACAENLKNQVRIEKL